MARAKSVEEIIDQMDVKHMFARLESVATSPHDGQYIGAYERAAIMKAMKLLRAYALLDEAKA